MAKELKVPAAVPAQPNRGPATRAGNSAGVPRMSDLRESGSIEQDADMTGLLYRSDYYAGDEDQWQQPAEQAILYLAQDRNGPSPRTSRSALKRNACVSSPVNRQKNSVPDGTLHSFTFLPAAPLRVFMGLPIS